MYSAFDKVINRRNTGCRKWDSMEEIFGDNELLPLWIADMDFAAPPAVIKAIQEKASHPVYGYHTRQESFYQAVVNWVDRRHDWKIEREWVANAPGVVPSISAAILAYTEPGDKIIIQPPVYPPFFSCVIKNGRKLVENPLKCNNGRYEMDFEDLKSKLKSGVKMLILCSPHNPVGRVWTKEELQQLSDICLANNVIILSDEIHHDLVFRGPRHTPIAKLSPEAAKSTITCISPSKTFNIAGFYTSFVVISDPLRRRQFCEVLEAMEIDKGHMFGITAAEVAYNEGEGWLEELLPYLENNADFLVDYISEKIPAIKTAKPDGTYLGWLDFRELYTQSADLKAFLVQKARVGLNDGRSFGVQGEGFARINFGCPREVLEEALRRIEAAVSSL